MIRVRNFCWLLAVTFGLQFAFDGVFSPASVLLAQSSDDEDPRPERNVQPMSLDTYEKLTKVAELMDEGELDKAKENLDRMLNRSRGLNGNEIANIYRNLVWWANETNQEDLAVDYLKQALEYREEIPYHIEEGVLYQIAQYAFQREDFEETLDYLMQWMDLALNHGSKHVYFLANTYWALSYQIEEEAFEEIDRRTVGLEPIEKKELRDEILDSYRPRMQPHLEQVTHWVTTAIDKAQEEALAELQTQYEEEPVPEEEIPGIEIIRESWWRLLVAAHDRLEQFEESLEIWELLATNHPKKEYFIGMHQSLAALDRTDESIYALEAAYWAGYLDTSDLIVSFVQKLGGTFSAIRALWILENEIDAELVEISPKIRKSQGQYASLSREEDRAIEYFEQYLEEEEDAKVYHQIAMRYFAVKRPTDCVEAAAKALELDKEQEVVRDVSSLKILQSLCMIEAGDLTGATKSLTNIRKEAIREDDEDTENKAKSYLNYIKSLERQIEYREEVEQRERDYLEEKRKRQQSST
ncbi:MAG: hypothetical protein OXH84_08455 [Gammaproteobacteria bacterium]|nr:hypothetical protein [Gammaproteobacteria bacterium]